LQFAHLQNLVRRLVERLAIPSYPRTGLNNSAGLRTHRNNIFIHFSSQIGANLGDAMLRRILRYTISVTLTADAVRPVFS
jgi:hypothetical protein